MWLTSWGLYSSVGVRNTDSKLLNNWILSFHISEENQYEVKVTWGGITEE